ncbi:MAG: helix-turn-helix domain-containing protein [Thermoplasmata archaeon]|nr:helix-turn-helix domain-containing protein [Thermoplasmata archaeon]
MNRYRLPSDGPARMPFELALRSRTPLTPLHETDEVLTEFLRWIGYLPEHDDARSGEGPVRESLGYRIVRDCLLRDLSRPWYAEELAAVLKSSKPSVYRHLNKLKSLDLLEEVAGSADGKGRKGYRLRYGNLSRAWDFTEANAQNALRRYRETVDHLQGLIERDATVRAAAPATRPTKSKAGANP